MSNGVLPQNPPPPSPMSLLQKLVMAKETFHLGKLNNQSALTQRLVRKNQDGTLGQPDPEGTTTDMPGDIKVGDQYPVVVVPPSQPQSAGIGTLGTVALTAASILGTGGIGAGAAYLMNKLMSPPAAVVPATPPGAPQGGNFTDTSTDIGLVK